MGNGNVISQLALLLWLPLSLGVASMLPPLRAFLVLMLGGTLLLPEQMAFDLPLLPPLTKHTITALSATIALLALHPDRFRAKLSSKATWYLGVLLVLSTTATVFANGDPLQYGPLFLPGLSLHDLVSIGLNDLMRVVLPFWLGQRLIRTSEDLKELLRALVIAGLCYSPFILLEARLSPIFHQKVYGFFQHDFSQAMRAGGFRAFVFMSHGLVVAFFVFQAVTCAFGLGRVKSSALPVPAAVVAWYLVVVLITCKTMSAFIYALVSVPLIWFTTPRLQLTASRWLSLAVVGYPMARALDLINTEWLLEQSRYWSEDRAGSLAFRLFHEGELLHKAQERLAFGWGSWGRNLIYDSATGHRLSVVDGEWIIQLGSGGAVRFLVVFGALLLPVFAASRAAARLPAGSDEGRLLGAFGLMLAMQGLDLVPNSIGHQLPYVFAGALASVASELSTRAKTVTWPKTGRGVTASVPS